DHAAFLGDMADFHNRMRLITDTPETALKIYEEVLSSPSPDTHIYICGPSGYIQALLDLARRLGWAESQLHKEAFSALPASDDGGDKPFTLQLARSGRTIEVPVGTTAIKALQDNGI